MNKYICLVLVGFSCIFSACYTDQDNTETEVTTSYPEVDSDTWLIANTSDMDLNGGEFSLQVGENTAEITEDQTILRLENVSKYNPLVIIKKANDIISFAKPFLLEFDVNLVSFLPFPNSELIPEISGLHQLSTLTNIELNNLNLVDKNDNTNSEAVIETKLISDPDILNQTGKHGYDRLGKLQFLIPIELIYLQAKSQSGEFLSIKSGELHINTNITEEQTLFYLDQSSGQWQEINAANESVNKFGFFLLAKKSDGTFIEGTMKAKGKFVAFEPFNIKYEHCNYQASSTSKGKYLAISPLDKVSELELKNPCNEVTQQIIITAGSEYLSYNNIELLNDEAYTEIDAQIIDCNGNITEQALINVIQEDESQSLRYFIDKDIDVVISSCAEDFKIQALDLNSSEPGPTIAWNKAWNEEIANLSSCADHKQGYTYIKIRDDIKVLDPFIVEIEDGKIFFRETNNTIGLVIDGTSRGDYLNEDVHIVIDDPNFGEQGYAIDCADSAFGCNIETCYLSHDGTGEDGWSRIRFAGNLWMQTINPASVGNFEVEGIILTK